MKDNVVKFEHTLEYLGRNVLVEWDVNLSVNIDIPDTTYLIIDHFNLTESYFEPIEKELTAFIKKRRLEIYLENASAVLASIENEEEAVVDYWDQLYTSHCAKFVTNMPKFTNLLEWCNKFNELLSASKQPELMRVLLAHKQTIDQLIRNRDAELASVRQEHDQAAKVFDEKTVLDTRKMLGDITRKWHAHIMKHQKLQREEFEQWVLGGAESHPIPSDDNDGWSKDSRASFEEELVQAFSFKFGYQLKCTHHINVCRRGLEWYLKISTDSPLYYPSILNNMLSLFTPNLSALVILTSDVWPPKSRYETQLANACLATTELHFPLLATQLASIEKHVVSKEGKLKNGDCFVTVHSNLAKVQVVFHLVTDFTDLNKIDISVNSPTMVGLGNIFEVILVHGLESLTLPFFMTYQYSSGMTTEWCSRQAEAMLKCVKNYIWQHTPFHSSPMPCKINLALPVGIPVETFREICSIVQQTYTQSYTLKLG